MSAISKVYYGFTISILVPNITWIGQLYKKMIPLHLRCQHEMGTVVELFNEIFH